MAENDLENRRSKLTNWKNEPKVSDLKQDLTQAQSFQSSQMSKIQEWNDLKNVEGSAKPKARPNRSSVQPKLVRKQAEWKYSALSEPFLNTDDIFSVSPKSYMDREAARQNEMILNYQFNNQLDKVNLIDKYVRSVVDDGTAIIRVGWEFEEGTVEEEQYVYDYNEATDPYTINLIGSAQQMYMSGDIMFKTLPDALRESVFATMENQRPIIATQKATEKVEVTKTIKNQPTVTICDPNNFIADPTCNGNFDNAKFAIYMYESSLSELKKVGIYENLDKIPEESNDGMYHNPNDSSFQYQDKARKKLVVYEYWGYWDIDDSGETKPIVASWVGDVMIRMELNPFPDKSIPFVVVPYLPQRNSIYGDSDAVLLGDNQKLIGALTRGMVDAMARSANSQIGFRRDALDALNRRKFKAGDDYEFSPAIGDPRAAIIEHSYPELPASTFNLLQLFNVEAESLTGTKTFNEGITGNAFGMTAAGVNGVLNASGKRELSILRRLSAGFEKVAKKILAMNGAWLSDEEVIRITDEQFISINRDNLLGSFDIKLSISSAENDNIKAQELAFMLQTMGSVLPFDMTKIILSEIARLRNMPDLSKVIEQFQPKPDPMQEIEIQKAQLELQMAQMDIQLKQAQINTELAKARKTSSEANLNDLAFVETESGVRQERELEKQQAQAMGNMKRDITKSILDTTLKSKDKA